MIVEKIHKLAVTRRGQVYLTVFIVAGAVIIWRKGFEYFLNYFFILSGFFIPIFVFVDLYGALRMIALGERVQRPAIYILVFYIVVSVLIFAWALDPIQAKLLLVIDSLICMGILIVMLYMTFMRKNKNV